MNIYTFLIDFSVLDGLKASAVWRRLHSLGAIEMAYSN